MRLPSLLLALVLAAPAVCGQPAARLGEAGILVVPAAPALAFDAGLGDPDAEAVTPPSEPASGPRMRGAWRGTKRGFVLGAAASVAAVGLVFLATGDRGDFSPWALTAVAAVPFTVLTTVAGGVIGAVRARPDPLTAEAP